jgi:ribosome production factor 1
MGRDKKIANAMKRGEVHRKSRREKEQDKLKRRMEVRPSLTSEGLATNFCTDQEG